MNKNDWFIRRPLFLGGLLVVGLVLSPRACGEPPAFGGFKTNALANEVTQFKGKLKGFQRGVLAVTREDGTDVMVQPPDDIANFNFVATAKPAFLQRGSLVRFSGAFGPTGMAAAPIEKVEVFQPVNVQQVQGHARERFIPGVYPADRHAQQRPAAMAKYNVVGNLMGINAMGVMMVQAGKQPLQVQLSQNASFELRFNNLNLAKEGDEVSVAGFYQPPDDTKVKAERVTITTDRVYGEPVAEEPPKRRTRGRRDDPEDAEKAPAEDAKKPAAEEKEGDDAKPAEAAKDGEQNEQAEEKAE